MKFTELARKRSSIRSYTPEPVTDKQLHSVLEAGCLAPTACNLQPFQILVVREKENLRALSAAYSRDWFKEAPVVLVLCTDSSKAWKRSGDERCLIDVDGAIVADHMTLAAAELGLGTCWIGSFDPAIVRRVLAIPEPVEPLVMLTLGHPNEPGRPKTRLPMDQLVRYEKWQNE